MFFSSSSRCPLVEMMLWTVRLACCVPVQHNRFGTWIVQSELRMHAFGSSVSCQDFPRSAWQAATLLVHTDCAPSCASLL